MQAAVDVRPRLRGRLHQAAFFVAVPAGLLLVTRGATVWARLALAVYAVSLAAVYAASASYHLGGWGPRMRERMRRLDHAAIYLLIAGTYTAFSVLLLDGAYLAVMLGLVWGGASAGIALKLSGTSRFRVLGGILYMVLGWIAVVAAPEFLPRMGIATLGLMLAGGLLFTGGAIVLLVRRPDPRPSVFGYHEVWHAMVIAGTTCHYLLLLMLAG